MRTTSAATSTPASRTSASSSSARRRALDPYHAGPRAVPVLVLDAPGWRRPRDERLPRGALGVAARPPLAGTGFRRRSAGLPGATSRAPAPRPMAARSRSAGSPEHDEHRKDVGEGALLDDAAAQLLGDARRAARRARRASPSCRGARRGCRPGRPRSARVACRGPSNAAAIWPDRFAASASGWRPRMLIGVSWLDQDEVGSGWRRSARSGARRRRALERHPRTRSPTVPMLDSTGRSVERRASIDCSAVRSRSAAEREAATRPDQGKRADQRQHEPDHAVGDEPIDARQRPRHDGPHGRGRAGTVIAGGRHGPESLKRHLVLEPPDVGVLRRQLDRPRTS